MKSMGDLLKRAIGQSEKLPPKYWTEGWNKFSFLMTPEQVKEVFEAYHMLRCSPYKLPVRLYQKSPEKDFSHILGDPRFLRLFWL